MKSEIDRIFDMLSWESSREEQERGMKLARHIENISVLIMPIEIKSVWENCAKVLAEKSDEKLRIYYIDLMKWLKDLNWPGAYVIYDRLTRVGDKDFTGAYRYCCRLAEQTNDMPRRAALNDMFADHERGVGAKEHEL